MRRRLLVVLTLAMVSALFIPAVAHAETDSTGADVLSSGTQSGTGWADYTNVTAAQAAAVSVSHCTGYGTDRAGVSSGGHTLSTRANVCGGFYGSSGSSQRWGPVIRFHCYRDGVLFGSGTGGCRWKGSNSTYLASSGGGWLHQYSVHFQVPPSSDPSYWADSGRLIGQAYYYSPGNTVQFCEDDWIYLNQGDPIGNGAVHLMGTTGIDYGVLNMGNRCTSFVI